MQVQVNTHNGVEGREAMELWATDEVNAGLARFKDHVTRVEVHISDENSGKAGADDKRCTMEARVVHQPPSAVTHHAPTVDEAFRGALRKLKHLLESTLDRRNDHRDRDSVRRDPDVVAPLLGETPAA